MPSIICFGDSITQGENDHLGGGWVDRLRIHFINEFVQTWQDETCVFNLGIGGETTAGLMKRFQAELLPRLTGKNDKVTLGYGANDLASIGGKQLVPMSDYAVNLSACINIAKEKNAAVFLVNILPISDAIEGVPNLSGKVRFHRSIKEYNQQLVALAAAHNVSLIDVHTPLAAEKETLFTPDGVHPNATGYEYMFHIMRKHLLAL